MSSLTKLQPDAESTYGYEQHLEHLYELLVLLYAGHAAHQTTVPAISPGGGRKRGRTCKVDDRCDDLAGWTAALIADEFPADDVDGLIRYDVPPNVFDISFSDGVHTVRDAYVAALISDATAVRLFPKGACAPVDPATTRPLFAFQRRILTS